MDLAAVSVLSLLGGYCLAIRWKATRYVMRRLDGHHLYFRAAWCGVACFIVAWVLRSTLNAHIASFRAFEEALVEVADSLMKVEPALSAVQHARREEWMLTAALSLLLSPPLALLMNCVTPRRLALRHSLGSLERVLHDGHTGGWLVALTLDSGKIYVGYVKRFLNSEDQPSDVEIEPAFSGYRDEQNQTVLTTDYEAIWEVLLRGRAHQLSLSAQWRDRWRLAIRSNSVVSAAPFDPAIYGEFNPHWRDQLIRRRWLPMQSDFLKP